MRKKGAKNASVPFFLDEQPTDVLPRGERLDGRGHGEFRNVFFRLGVVSKAQGSCYAEVGPSKVMVGVYGPRQMARSQGYSDQGHLSCDVKFANFATRQRTESGQSPQEKELSATLQRTFQGAVCLGSYPKATIEVFVTVLESGGDDVGVVISAASLALADAGIELMDTVAACSVCRVGEVEEDLAGGVLTLGFLPSVERVSHLECRGTWSQTAFNQAVEIAVGGCKVLDEVMRGTLREAAAAVS